ncbi:unnamed protein product [Medioppia subpectinata]|uniref:Elongation of very long chain fatty acids protein n=1 Tax=Medioppia subpectinata TaxID=1979941 RepID=A0A7R9KM01_9ACAR|nr:unnamed protein product [Medioppia subpectinata]CAG2106066.1 unnamed protein product [Medioppia subpectinata]
MFGSEESINKLLVRNVSTDWSQFAGLPFAFDFEARFAQMFGSEESLNKLLVRNVSTDWSQFAGLPFAFDFEARFARDFHRQWLYHHWWVSIYVCVLYVTLVLVGQHVMSRRPKPLSLRVALFCWNLFLAFFSIVGTIRCLPEFVSVIRTSGLESSYCVSSYYDDVRLTFWYWVFVWSKVVELGDTGFIIARKQTLIPLHWIHHVLTLSYAFFVIGEAPASARWMVNMNFTIHSLMYSYYALKAIRVPVSRTIAMAITTAQILQMVFGLYINFFAFHQKWSGRHCDTSISASASGLILYALFFALFINFFAKTYGNRFTLKSMKRLLSGAAKDVLNKVD